MKQLTQDTAELVKMLDNLRKVEFRLDEDYFTSGRSLVKGISYLCLKDFCETTEGSRHRYAREMCKEICEASKEIQKKYEEKLSNMIFDELDKQYNKTREA